LINFCHIFPTHYLDQFAKYNKSHLILAHLVDFDQQYREFYADLDDQKEKIMDNGAFEMFKRGLPMYEPSKLIEMGKHVNADVIVLPDYPMSPYLKTIEKSKQYIEAFKENGFKTFFVPQSQLGDIDGYIRSLEWAINNEDIDVIGLSILGCPIALGLEEQKFEDSLQYDEGYRMQRFLSRWKIFRMIDQMGLLGDKTKKRFHCLGLVDGPNEIDLLEPYTDHIRSWDSSSAFWLGACGGKLYDDSPTGLRNGKFEIEVDFSRNDLLEENLDKAIRNIEFINQKENIA